MGETPHSVEGFVWRGLYEKSLEGKKSFSGHYLPLLRIFNFFFGKVRQNGEKELKAHGSQ